jgi:hypothetical protein
VCTLATIAATCAADKANTDKTASPDKLYEVREANDDTNKVGQATLHVRKTGEQLLDLAAPYELKGRAEYTRTSWRSDSRAFAFSYAFLTKGATIVYRKTGATFEPLPLPKLPPMGDAAGQEKPEPDPKLRVDSVYPIRWQKGGVLILEEFRVYGEEGSPSDTSYRKITVTVPDRGPLLIKKIENADYSMREEINR